LSISKGNMKIGALPSFSLPALQTCPGKTDFCADICYGLRGNFVFLSVKNIYKQNQIASTGEGFVDSITNQIRKTHAEAFRLHVVGDFYCVPYIEKWMEIARRLPEVSFFGSTRSWRTPGLANAVGTFRDMPNVYIKASIDPSNRDSPDDNWGVWSIEGKGYPCPHDFGLVENCKQCGRCWSDQFTDIRFNLRWGRKKRVNPDQPAMMGG